MGAENKYLISKRENWYKLRSQIGTVGNHTHTVTFERWAFTKRAVKFYLRAFTKRAKKLDLGVQNICGKVGSVVIYET